MDEINDLSQYMNMLPTKLRNDPSSLRLLTGLYQTGHDNAVRTFLNAGEPFQRYLVDLQTRAIRDPLTGLKDVGEYKEYGATMISLLSVPDGVDLGYERTSSTISDVGIIAIDINAFKKLNDTLGHDSGDVVLNKLARVMEKSLYRDGDVPFRRGGDEFTAIVVNADGKLKEIGERVRSDFLEVTVAERETIPGLDLAIGYALTETQINFDILNKEADSALYRDKARMKDEPYPAGSIHSSIDPLDTEN